METVQRSRLMRLSWEIQKRRNSTRSKSLLSAWAIYLNEDLTVYHLVQKHNSGKQATSKAIATLTLFHQ